MIKLDVNPGRVFCSWYVVVHVVVTAAVESDVNCLWVVPKTQFSKLIAGGWRCLVSAPMLSFVVQI